MDWYWQVPSNITKGSNMFRYVYHTHCRLCLVSLLHVIINPSVVGYLPCAGLGNRLVSFLQGLQGGQRK